MMPSTGRSHGFPRHATRPSRSIPRRLLLAALAGITPAACGRRPPLADGGDARGRVVLLRGLANIFSLGMDVLGERLVAAGYGVEVHNHTEWRELAERIVAEHRARRLPRPFAIAGHSLGADSAIHLAGAAGAAGVATDLLVTFDPVFVASVPRGPRAVLNFHQDAERFGIPLRPEPGFDGRIENLAFDASSRLNHFNIEDSVALHERVVAALDRLAASATVRPIPRPDLPPPA